MRRNAEFALLYDYDSDHLHTVPDDGREWACISGGGPFPDMAGPMFVTYDDLLPGEPARFGLRVERHHCNAVDVVHGGMLATFADTALAQGLLSLGDIAFNTPTINLSVDFLSGAVLGEWLESRVTIDHRTRRMAFASAVILAGTRAVLRVTSLFKTSPRPLQEQPT
jgi:acyl-coenzyme A thioesterase PaaI-like protein